MIFCNKVFWDCILEITENAIISKNFAFLKSVPVPLPEDDLTLLNVLSFWELSYKQEWGSDQWDNYMMEHWCDRLICMPHILVVDNPKIFESEPIRKFLEAEGIFDEPLAKAIEYDSLAFARYLLKEYGLDRLKSMLGAFMLEFWAGTIASIQRLP